MFKCFSLVGIVLIAGAAFGVQQKPDKSVHHAAMHAEHWVKNHVSAPHHRKHHRKVKRKKHDKSVHHAAMHAEHWLKHHVAAPHKKKGG